MMVVFKNCNIKKKKFVIKKSDKKNNIILA